MSVVGNIITGANTTIGCHAGGPAPQHNERPLTDRRSIACNLPAAFSRSRKQCTVVARPRFTGKSITRALSVQAVTAGCKGKIDPLQGTLRLAGCVCGCCASGGAWWWWWWWWPEVQRPLAGGNVHVSIPAPTTLSDPATVARVGRGGGDEAARGVTGVVTDWTTYVAAA